MSYTVMQYGCRAPTAGEEQAVESVQDRGDRHFGTVGSGREQHHVGTRPPPPGPLRLR